MAPRHDDAAVESAAERGALQIARGLLLLLALLLPFETPLFRLGPLQITTVELALYLLLAVWPLVLVLRAGRIRVRVMMAVSALRGDAAARAALLWVAVTFASATVAPTDRAACLKFALRSLSGVLAFFAARTLARPPEVGRRVLLALVAGALLSAVTAAVEVLAPSIQPALGVFRQGAFGSLGLVRASGVFAYPTIGAMYWEAAVPLVIAAPFLGRKARPEAESARGVALATVGSALLVAAILASATRSGLAGAAILGAGMMGLTWRSGRGVRRSAAAVLAVSLALGLSATLSGSLLGQRMRWWLDDTWFRVEYQANDAPPAVRVRELFSVPVTLRNAGTIPWPHAGDHPVHLAYHWERLDGPTARTDFDGPRTALSVDVPPGGAIDLIASARGPDSEGAYLLRWDLVQEDVTWFSERGNPTPTQRVDVISAFGTAASAAPVTNRVDLGPPTVASRPPTRVALWRAAVVLWRQRPLLGIGPDNFRRRYPAVLLAALGARAGDADSRIHANSLYFETLADLGLAGVLALAALAIALVRLIRHHYSARCLLGLACSMAAGAFFVHGLFDYFFEFTPLLGLFWVLLGLTSASGTRAASPSWLPGSKASKRLPGAPSPTPRPGPVLEG
jgi:hypothetical protein